MFRLSCSVLTGGARYSHSAERQSSKNTRLAHEMQMVGDDQIAKGPAIGSTASSSVWRNPATRRMTALGYVETGLLIATVASIWIGVLAVVAAVILKAIR